MSSVVERAQQELDEFFPAVEPGHMPLGARVLVQLKKVRKQTASGIILAEETQDTEQWNNQVAKMVGFGGLAYRNRQTRELWPEGEWAQPGEYVRVPRWGGDRWEVKDSAGDAVTFVIFNDLEVIAKVTGDPLQIRSFIL